MLKEEFQAINLKGRRKGLWDTDTPSGIPRKLLDSEEYKDLGQSHTVPLETGLSMGYRWYFENSRIF